ncbi:hypothetical protein QAD02_023486 [Eretmocerus hayati]|uniref:Uncharacterized protein n=1 Tax=Eretmocerus hayati TaxID=131215 RepID=A0ACC2PWC3_9HYME|nr:hypothetical protein QAD02_023486 [Eretmocerus hayati]
MWPSLIFIAAISSLSVLPAPIKAIYGGKPASIENFPYQISLEHLGKHKCGGAIVSPNFVLTSANCVYKLNPVDLKIHFGADKLTLGLHSSDPTSHYDVDNILIHENFTHSKYDLHLNDVALLHVKEPFKFDSTCQAVKLIDQAEFEKLQPGVLANVTGWGKNSESLQSEQLQVAEVPFVDRETCAEVYDYIGFVTESHLCSGVWGEGGVSPCKGDEGGPLTINGQLVGLVMKSQCGHAFQPDVYTSVAHFSKWILEHIDAHLA